MHIQIYATNIINFLNDRLGYIHSMSVLIYSLNGLITNTIVIL